MPGFINATSKKYSTKIVLDTTLVILIIEFIGFLLSVFGLHYRCLLEQLVVPFVSSF